MRRQPETAPTPGPDDLLIGIDWADREHTLCLFDGEQPPEHSRLEQDPQAIAEWVAGLQSRFPGRQITIALEQSHGALIHALLGCDGLVLYPINPKQLANYRKAFAPSGAKSDPADAELLAMFLREHQRRLRPFVPDDPLTRKLARLTELRRREVDERKRFVQQLTDCLKLYFPLLLTLFANKLADELLLGLLRRWPSLAELKRAHPRTLRKFLAECGVRDRDRQTKLIEGFRAAVPLTADKAIIEPNALYAQSLARRIAELNASVENFDKQIAAAVAVHPDESLFRAVPGAGDVLVPRLIAAFGTDRSRYDDAAQMQTYSGIAPVTKESGSSRQVVKRFHCPVFLRQTFHEFADQARKWSRWSKAFYRMKRAAGFRHQAAVRALAFKWIRILYRLWQTRETYDEARYLKQLERRCSPVLQYLESA
jgi:transposase